jgi:hypothetical protein
VSEHLGDLAHEWEQLCEWFKSNAVEAATRTKSLRGRESILCTLAGFLRDEPPKTIEGLREFRSFAQRHVDLWTTAPLETSSSEMPLVVGTESHGLSSSGHADLDPHLGPESDPPVDP